ncbi:N-acetyltransferase [Phycicoccus endophyticus]|nr:N-acetyltransferase [Phycicoccus endophyticus]
MTVRAAHWSDLRALAALETRIFPDDAWTEASWWAELAGRPRREYLVLEAGGALAGYAGLDHGGEVADVMTLAVVPQRRGDGLGRLLLESLEAAAAARGAGHLMLEVRADNAAALALYARGGFEVLTRRRGYYHPGAVDAVVMRKHLAPKGADDA